LVIAADPALLHARAKLLNLDPQIEEFSPLAERTAHRARRVRVIATALATPAEAGQLNIGNAPYVLALLDRAVEGCLAGEFDALVTAPVQKSVLNEAGATFTGHTEYIAACTNTSRPVMMLVAERLRVALATTHLPLRSVSDALSSALLQEVMAVIDADLRKRFGFARPRILVCGLNPHAGESGHLGREEIEIIAPAVAAARSNGINASGPVPADTAFTPRSLAGADVVLAMYHDQGLPVLKFAGFGGAVNVTLGLPFIRTSVDHGTALDLAGTGQADVGSLAAALQQAIDLAQDDA